MESRECLASSDWRVRFFAAIYANGVPTDSAGRESESGWRGARHLIGRSPWPRVKLASAGISSAGGSCDHAFFEWLIEVRDR